MAELNDTQITSKKSEIISSKDEEAIIKSHYENWTKFKDELFQYLFELTKIGKVKTFFCNNCHNSKDIMELNVYDLFFGFSLDKFNTKKETIENFNVVLCNECNEMNDTTNSYIKVLRNHVSCAYCKKLIYQSDEHLELDNKSFCSRECLRKYLNKTIK